MTKTYFNFRYKVQLCIICISNFCRQSYLSKHLIAGFVALLFTSQAALSENVILRHSFAGNISFALAGNTLRSSSNTCAPISGGESSSTINIPIGATMKAAYLYWSGSGSVDSTIVFNNSTLTADISHVEVFQGRNYFSSKKDVTNLISVSSTSHKASGVTFNGSASYCNVQSAYAGWALAVIYEHTGEPLRVINVFDGFKNFWGSELDLIPDNFVIAQNPAAKGGKHAHITWEGDANNSQPRSNFNETLRFENNNLTGTNNPNGNQFNGYSNISGGRNTSGVDIDEYQIGSYLTAGDTSVHTTYSSGQDAVFLTAELISVPNEPVADLSIQQTGPSRFIRGENNTVNFTVYNNGPSIATSSTEISIPLPTGLSLNSFTGNQWSCNEISANVICNYTNDIANNASANSLSISFYSDNSTNNSVNITATVTGVVFDNILSNNTRTQTYSVISADLSTSSKSVTDLNGGNVQAGEKIRYTIDLIETNGVAKSGISVVDNLPNNISSFEVISLPNGASNNSQQAPAGSNSTGLISISNISVAANATESIVIDAIILASSTANTAIENTATISAQNMSDITISSPTIYVSKPANPATGNKPLYLRQSSNLSRVQPTSSAFHTLADLAERTYIITPAFQQEFIFSDSTVSAYLFLQNDYNRDSWGHTVTVTLLRNNISIGSVTRTISVPSVGLNGDNVALFEFSIPLSGTPTLDPNDTLSLKVANDSQYGEDSLRIYSIDPNVNNADSISPYSLVSLPAATVINVDNISILDNNSQEVSEASPTETIIIQAEISDPFGAFDITSSNITITNSQGTTLVNKADMSFLSEPHPAKKIFQFSFNLAADAELGDWSISVTALEGVENDIEHTSESTFKIVPQLPNITLTKNVDVYSDPIHGTNTATSFAKAIPNAVLTYTISASNSGPGAAQINSIWIADAIPLNMFMNVLDFDDVADTGPIKVLPSASPSGLNYNFESLSSNSDDLEFSANNGASFTYSPTPDSDGIDENITHFRINPKGIFQAPAAGESPTQFTIKFRVRLQ